MAAWIAAAAIIPQVLPSLSSAVKEQNTSFLPKDTPAFIVDRLHRALFASLDTPAVRDRLIQLGANMITPERRSSTFLRQFVADEVAKWGGIIKGAGITPQ